MFMVHKILCKCKEGCHMMVVTLPMYTLMFYFITNFIYEQEACAPQAPLKLSMFLLCTT